MRFKNRFRLVALMSVAACVSLNAKETEGVIMTVDGEEIPTDEFLYLYQKNNQQQVQPQSLDEYLKLFEVYRLKVAEAKSQGVDTTSNFKKEMALYRRELLEPYVTDTVFFNRLVDIAMEREKELVESSHIMFIRTHDEAKDKKSLERLDSIRQELLNGADFSELAKAFSQDKFSSDKGGYLGFTPAGTFPYGFETAVYETPEGEISEIIESHVGWHIVKAGGRKSAEEMNKPQKSYEEVKNDVARKVTSPFDSRFFQIRDNRLKMLKERHPEINTENLTPEAAYNALMDKEERDQYQRNEAYRNLVDEYVNGSLLYEVSVENVWNKAANDDEGLENYYNLHKDNYKWETPHAKGFLVLATNDSIAGLIKTAFVEKTSDNMASYIKTNFKKDAVGDKFNVVKGTNPYVDLLVFGEQITVPENKYPVYFIEDGRIVEQPEGLDDVKSLVINDYQEILEQEWVDNLKEKHKVWINKKELDKVRKQFHQK